MKTIEVGDTVVLHATVEKVIGRERSMQVRIPGISGLTTLLQVRAKDVIPGPPKPPLAGDVWVRKNKSCDGCAVVLFADEKSVFIDENGARVGLGTDSFTLYYKRAE